MAQSRAQNKDQAADEGFKTVATHRKARMLFEILETFEAGLALKGAEVKALRCGRAVLDGCFGREKDGELYLFNFYIPPYEHASLDAPEPRRDRKLLLHRREIDKIRGKLQTKGLTLVPLSVYFKRGWAKVSVGLARGKAGRDRRDDLKKADLEREAAKSFKGKFKA